MPLSQTIEVITSDGSGGTTTTERTLPTTSFGLVIDGVTYEPEIVNEMEIENGGDDNSVSDQCGNTERNRTGNDGWAIRVSGIITGNDRRQGNLSLAVMSEIVASLDSVQVAADIKSGTYEVGNVLITDASDLVSIQTSDTNGKEKAYEFQLQLGQTQSQ